MKSKTGKKTFIVMALLSRLNVAGFPEMHDIGITSSKDTTTNTESRERDTTNIAYEISRVLAQSRGLGKNAAIILIQEHSIKHKEPLEQSKLSQLHPDLDSCDQVKACIQEIFTSHQWPDPNKGTRKRTKKKERQEKAKPEKRQAFITLCETKIGLILENRKALEKKLACHQQVLDRMIMNHAQEHSPEEDKRIISGDRMLTMEQARQQLRLQEQIERHISESVAKTDTIIEELTEQLQQEHPTLAPKIAKLAKEVWGEVNKIDA